MITLKIITPLSDTETMPVPVVMAIREILDVYPGSSHVAKRGSPAEGEPVYAAIARNRNAAIRDGGYTAYDYVLCCDSDTAGKSNDVAALIALSGGERIVSAAYRHRANRKWACAAVGDNCDWLPTCATGQYVVRTVGAGFLLIPATVLAGMARKGRKAWFETREIGGVQVGEGVCFCMNAQEAGYSIVVDCDHFVHHMTEVKR
jgi:hypothetical protein